MAVAQLQPQNPNGPAYAYHDSDGLLLGTMVERPLVDGRPRGRQPATLDLVDVDGDLVLRLTSDRDLVDQAFAALGWAPLRPWGYVVLGADLDPVAWVPMELRARRVWQVHCLGSGAPIVLRAQRIGTGRKAPRPVMMGGVPVAQITLVSPRTEPDTYVLGLSSGPQDGGLATVLAALVPLYDQVVHAMLPLAWGTLDI